MLKRLTTARRRRAQESVQSTQEADDDARPDDDEPVEKYGDDVGPFAVGDAGVAPERVVPRPADEYWERHDIVVDGVTIRDPRDKPAIHLRAASVRGLSHRYYGTPRQDAYAFRTTGDNRWLVVAVADGVSRGTYSHLAADIVVGAGCGQLADRLAEITPDQVDWPELLHALSTEIISRARAELRDAGQDESAATDREVADHCAATALFAVVGLDSADVDTGAGERPLYVVAVGDTSAWLLSPEQQVRWRRLGQVDTDEPGVASSATTALPLPQPRVSALVDTLRPGEALVLITDGIGDPLGAGTGDVGRFLADSWSEPPPPIKFAAQVDFARKSFDDDRTAVVLWALGSRSAPPASQS